ncbi:MAG TPA: flagellar hook-basal body complex protein, partial [Accumulibacter sp.]|nr:flagellar hook-basal body complex protein [Accumulibacter sp.]
MSFQQGLSGLNGAAAALNVIGNNVANASTVGFKGANTQFGDMYAASLGMTGSSQIGIGVNVGAVAQQFTQGNLTTTNNSLDLALNGGGFFRMSNNGELSYTRNGQFHVDKDGYVVNDQKLRLTGYPAAPNGLVTTSSPVELQLSASQMAPRATDDPLSGNLTAVLNLDSRETVPTVSPFDYANPQSYNFSTALSVYDSLGNPHNLTTFYVLNTPTAPVGNEWTVYATLDGANPQLVPGGNLIFDTSGNLDPASAQHALPTWALTTGATTPWSPGLIDYGGTTQYGSESSADRLTQGGY